MDIIKELETRLKEIEKEKPDAKFVIMMHDCPDPDCISSAMGVKYIIKKLLPDSEVLMVYGGEVSHPQNKTMVNVLNVPMLSFKDVDSSTEGGFSELGDYYICVDSLPERCCDKKQHCLFVLDHHKGDTKLADIKDIRSNGATASLVYEYLVNLGLDLDAAVDDDANLATALLVGIKTDTQDCITENVTSLDLEAYAKLQPLVNHKSLASIINYSIPPYYFELRKNLDIEENIHWDNGVFIGGLGYVNPSKRDVLSSLAEERSRVESVDTAFIFAIVGKNIEVSVRSSSFTVDVNSICQTTFGKEFAGGKTGAGAARIPMNYLSVEEAPEEIKKKVWDAVRDFMKYKIITEMSEHR